MNAFTSTLSVSEALLVREAGFRPLRQVMGTCFLRTGWQSRPGTGFGPGWQTAFRNDGDTVELAVATKAWNDARKLALGRLHDEAVAARADAVVGVEIARRSRGLAHNGIEITAIGTAVRSERYELPDAPVISNLSGQDFTKLFAAGHWPVGVVAGSTVAYALSGWGQARRSGSFLSGMRNQELPDFSRGLSEARHLALERLENEAHRVHAHGIVGVEFTRRQSVHHRDQNQQSFTDLMIEIHMLGTAIVELEPKRPGPAVYTALTLGTAVT